MLAGSDGTGAANNAPAKRRKHSIELGELTIRDVTAQEHPGSHVIGTDLSKIQPALPMVQNCEFVKDDAEEEWLYRTPGTGAKMLFDYVHLRMVFTCFPDNQVVMRHAFENMRPGGWIEYCDLYIDPLSRDGRHEGE